jgi:2-iminobutanoate/2-iminopropanoate deaminase
MAKIKIETTHAPVAIGPYSQGVQAGDFIFASGQIPLAADGTSKADRPMADQAKQALENLAAVLKAAKSSMANVVKTTVYLTDLADFSEMNRIYGQFFSEPFPARTTVQVAALPKGAKIEIEAMALQ